MDLSEKILASCVYATDRTAHFDCSSRNPAGIAPQDDSSRTVARTPPMPAQRTGAVIDPVPTPVTNTGRRIGTDRSRYNSGLPGEIRPSRMYEMRIRTYLPLGLKAYCLLA